MAFRKCVSFFCWLLVHVFFLSFLILLQGIYQCAIETNVDCDHYREFRKPASHAIVIVGYGIVYGTIWDNNGVSHPDEQEFFWCQNTFGPDWGRNGGYAKIAISNFIKFYAVTGARFFKSNPNFKYYDNCVVVPALTFKLSPLIFIFFGSCSAALIRPRTMSALSL